MLSAEADTEKSDSKYTNIYKKFVPNPMEVDSISATKVTVRSIPTEHEDEFDLLAKLVAVKLRNLPQDKLARVRQFLNLVLFDTLPKYCLIDKLIANT